VSGRECVGAAAKRLLTENGKLHRPEADDCDYGAERDQTGAIIATTADSATTGELVADVFC
jgi:hypothetical protein